jgi:Universal stress protein family
MFKHVLIATDGSELAERAVAQGLQLAKVLNAKVTAVTATEPWTAGVVSVAVIGHNVVIGYIDDDTTGKEILDHVAECRKTGCPDAVQKLLEQTGRYDEASAPSSSRRVGCVQDRNASQALEPEKAFTPAPHWKQR